MVQKFSTWRSRVLGVFILFQLVYLPAANFIKLVALRLPESTGELDDDIQLRGQQFPDRVQAAADGIGTAFVRYGELTGQAQGWSLFAPVFGHQASLPMVEVRWLDGRPVDLLHSRFQPRDPDRNFRWPSYDCRLFNYEYRLTLLYWTWTKDSFEAQPADWSRAAIARVRRQQDSIYSYLSWRSRDFWPPEPLRREDLEAKEPPIPSDLRLIAELTPAPPFVGGARPKAWPMPIARRDYMDVRQFPESDWSRLPPTRLEAWDPVSNRFVRVWSLLEEPPR